jgi:hypothetical protein
MSATAQFFALAAILLAGLFAIWFLLKSRIARYLELENLLGGVREEARSLVRELNETADRNVSLVEDRMNALRELLDEVDRRIGVEKKELETRAVEREVYAKLARRRPIVPATEPFPAESAGARTGRGSEASYQATTTVAEAYANPPTETAERRGDEPIPLSLGPSAVEPSLRAPDRVSPDVRLSDDLLLSSKTKREEALDLYRSGISAQLIAARLGATVAEIELLVEMEERRAEGGAGAF